MATTEGECPANAAARRSRVTPKYCVSLRTGAIAASSTDKPVRGGPQHRRAEPCAPAAAGLAPRPFQDLVGADESTVGVEALSRPAGERAARCRRLFRLTGHPEERRFLTGPELELNRSRAGHHAGRDERRHRGPPGWRSWPGSTLGPQQVLTLWLRPSLQLEVPFQQAGDWAVARAVTRGRGPASSGPGAGKPRRLTNRSAAAPPSAPGRRYSRSPAP